MSVASAQSSASHGATMTCGCPEWECDLLGHHGCTVVRREVPRPNLLPAPRPRPIGPRTNNPFGVTLVAALDENRPAYVRRPGIRPRGLTLAQQRQAARDAKRTNEHVKSAKRAWQQREATERRRRADAERALTQLKQVLAGGCEVDSATGLRVEHVQPSRSVQRGGSRALPSCQRVRVWQIARRIGKPSAEVVQMLRDAGEWVRNAQSTVVAPAATAFITAQEA